MRYTSYFLFFLIFLVFSCQSEKDPGEKIIDAEKKSIVLKISVSDAEPPAINSIAKHSMTEAQEKQIVSLDVLAFRVEGAAETFLYHTVADIDVNEYSVEASIHEFSQRFVVIANAQSQVEALVNANTAGTAKETMLRNLVFEMDNDGKWQGINTVSPTPFPMWSETAPEVVNAQTETANNGEDISLQRMVAKVEVKLEGAATSNFALESVHVYNINTVGRIAPNSSDYSNKIASLPASPNPKMGVANSVEYSVTGGVSLLNSIYVFEAAAKSPPNYLEEICIVVGGIYDGDLTYYRLDFLDPATELHNHILRNHRYTFTITRVDGPGKDTPEEAFNFKRQNIDVEISWETGLSAGDINFDRQYELNVSEHTINVGLAGGNIDLKIDTTHPAGWTAYVWGNLQGTVPATWATITATNNDGITINVAAATSPRTAYIHVNAGNRLINKVEISQK